jgi:CRP/FNR family transcriptional regulator, polysaccharide utilization system transcription regulator
MSNNNFMYQQKATAALEEIFNCCPTVVQHHLGQHVEIRNISKDSILIRDGEMSDGVLIILEGSIKLYLKKEKKDQVFLFKTVNEMLGLQQSINKERYNYYASAMEDTVVAFIPIRHVLEILSMHPNAFLSLMKMVNQKAIEIESRTSLMMTDTAEKVVVKTIEDLKNRFGTDSNGYIKIHIPVKDLASYVCMSKTNLYRVLQTLKDKMIITHHLDRYRLNNNLSH